MWPFRKKPEPAPYRWWVEEKLEQQVILARQREPRAQLVARMVAANMSAMRNAGLDRYRRECLAAALPCSRCGQFHAKSLPGDCRTWAQNVGPGAASGFGSAFH